MYAIICLREKDGKDIPIPIMQSDEDGDPTETMALWDRYTDAVDFCHEHILCKASQNIIIDIETGDGLVL